MKTKRSPDPDLLYQKSWAREHGHCHLQKHSHADPQVSRDSNSEKACESTAFRVESTSLHSAPSN